MTIFQETSVLWHAEFTGDGYLAGQLPPDSNPDELDGRTKILNVPARVRVVVLDRRTLRCVASVLSASDGTWVVTRLNRTRPYMIVGYLGGATVNAAIQDSVTPAEMA